MAKSITRKFLVKELPKLPGSKDTYERHYLYVNSSIVIRVQKVNESYELERKVDEREHIRKGEKIQVTKDEFEELKKLANQHIIRDSYRIQESPRIVIRIYKGDFNGLKRIEVNFSTLEESQSFTPLEWFGKEITETPLAQDGKLLQLTKEEFQKLLA